MGPVLWADPSRRYVEVTTLLLKDGRMIWSKVVRERMRRRTDLSDSHGGGCAGTNNVLDLVDYSGSSVRQHEP